MTLIKVAMWDGKPEAEGGIGMIDPYAIDAILPMKNGDKPITGRCTIIVNGHLIEVDHTVEGMAMLVEQGYDKAVLEESKPDLVQWGVGSIPFDEAEAVIHMPDFLKDEEVEYHLVRCNKCHVDHRRGYMSFCPEGAHIIDAKMEEKVQ